MKYSAHADDALNMIFAENTSKARIKTCKNSFFLPVRKLPTLIDFGWCKKLGNSYVYAPLKGPKHDQVEGEFFYIKQTRMVR